MDLASEFEAIRPRYPELKGQVALVTGSSRGIGKAIALRLAKEGIRMNAIAPGAIRVERTPAPDDLHIEALVQRIPMKRMGTALEIGAMAAFLASDDAAYITGQVLYVDGDVTAQLSPPGQPI